MMKYRPILTAALIALVAIVTLNRLAKASSSNLSPASGDVGISADHFFYHGDVVIYLGNVVVTNAQGKMCCAQLTIHLPAEGSLDRQPTNAVAETNVVLDLIKKGETNHITCDQAIYTYQVVDGKTNDTITFIGSADHPAKVANAKGWMTGEPLIWDNISGNFSGSDTETHFQLPPPTKGTNQSGGGPLNFLKPSGQ